MKDLGRWFSAALTHLGERRTLQFTALILGAVVIVLIVGSMAIWGGSLDTQTVSINATVVESSVDEQPRYDLAKMEDDNPVELAVEVALVQNGSGTHTTTREKVERAEIPYTTFYVKHHDMMFKVTVERNNSLSRSR